METASTRKTAMRIHSSLLNKIAVMGQRKFAEAMGVHESQVSRWKGGMLETMSMALAVLNYGIADDEMAELARRVAAVLAPGKKSVAEAETTFRTLHSAHEKAPKNCEFFEA